MASGALATEEIVAAYGPRRALDRVSIAVNAGRTLAVVGPSGAGKTTLLRVIAGLLRPHSGDVTLGGRSILNDPPQRRRIALVFQDDALFANMTVRANLRFGLRSNGPASHVAVRDTAVALHVGDVLDRRPRELSGGERQRASIARALLSEPLAMLMDEPLAHLDPSLRRAVREEVVGLRERYPGPIVYVTHDHAEAMSVGDELAILIDGRIEDSGDPAAVFDRPRTIGVARFLGERPMNVLDGDPLLGIRPEHVRVVETAGAALGGRVTRREPTGADVYLDIDTPRGSIAARVPANRAVRTGDAVGVEFPEEFVRTFDRATGIAIR